MEPAKVNEPARPTMGVYAVAGGSADARGACGFQMGRVLSGRERGCVCCRDGNAFETGCWYGLELSVIKAAATVPET